MPYKQQHSLLAFLFLVHAFCFSACSGGSEPVATATFTVGGTVSGLGGSGLVLQLNGANDLAIAAYGAFTFGVSLADGATYSVSVLSAPAGETCSVSMGNGTIAGADVTNVEVACSTESFTVGGEVTGLSGPGLVLQLNGANDLALSADGPFTFPVGLADGAGYAVTVLSMPADVECEVLDGSGTIAGADVTDVEVTCDPLFTVGGLLAGLDGGNLVLQLNGANDLTLTADGPFEFATFLPDGSAYEVTVLTSPAGMVCELGNAMGAIGGADVTSVTALCFTQIVGLAAVDGSTPSIYSAIDSATGAATPITTNIEFDQVAGLAYDPASHRLYGSDVASSTLLAIDPLIGTATVIGAEGALGIAKVNGLAFDSANEILYGISSPDGAMTGQLVRIDTTTGVGTPVGIGFSIGATSCLGLAYHSGMQVLFTSTADGRIIEVNPLTGASRGSAALGAISPVEGLAYDSLNDRLYGILSKQRLIRIDPITGQASFIGLVNGFFGMEGLEFADDLATLFASSVRPLGGSFLLEIDETNVVATTVGSVGFTLTGLAADPATDVVFGITVNSQLVRMDRDTGAVRYLARVNTPNEQKTRSLAFNSATGTLFTYAIDPAPTGEDSLVEFNQFGFLLQDHGPSPTLGGDFEALAIDTSGPTMYGILDRGIASPCQLYRVDPTGSVQLLHVLTNHDELRSLAFDQSTATTTPTFFSADVLTDRLITIDLASGATADVGPSVGARGMVWIAP